MLSYRNLSRAEEEGTDDPLQRSPLYQGHYPGWCVVVRGLLFEVVLPIRQPREMRVMRRFAEWTGGSAEERALLAQCRDAGGVIVPGAAAILYRSRCRGAGRAESVY